MNDLKQFWSYAKKAEILIAAIVMLIGVFAMSYSFAFACVLMGHDASVCGL